MKYKHRIHPSDYALGETEQFYSDMEERGWRLLKRGAWFSKFEPVEPSRTRYRVEVSAPGFLEDPSLTEGQLSVYADCGWEYVTSCGLLHIFRSPAGSGAPEFYTDPQQQAATLKKLKRGCVWGWTPAVLVVLYQGLLGYMMNSQRFFERTAGQFIRAWVEHTSFQAACWALLIWGLVAWSHDAWQISRTYYRMKKGRPLDHNPKNRHIVYKCVHWAVLAVFLVLAGLTAWQYITTSSTDLQPAEEVPYLRLSELGWEGKPASFMGRDSGAAYSKSLLAEYWDTVEYLDDSEGLQPWIYQDVYRLRDASLAERLARALMADATFGGNFQPLETEGLDAAWSTGGMEVVAIKGNMVAYLTYLPGTYDNLNPRELCQALAEKWT